MEKRIPLKPNTELRVRNQEEGLICYYIDEIAGFGGSCVVYQGYYKNNVGQKKTVQIKECYPYKISATRAADQGLCVDENQVALFEEYKERLKRSFQIANELFTERGLSNSLSNTLDLYESNQTIYIVSAYVEGKTLGGYQVESLKEAIQLVKSTAISISKIHQKGYVYLDIKPDNIMVMPETKELIQLFDFDSMLPMGIEGQISDYHISYSLGFAPVEQVAGDLVKIGVRSDVYGIAALLFYLVFERVPSAIDCGFDSIYDYSEIKKKYSFPNRLYEELNVLFHHSLQSFYEDRYATVEELIAQLEKVENYANYANPFLYSFPCSESESLLGREKELEQIEAWMKSDAMTLFVTGMGGIGKSSLVRSYVSTKTDKLEHMIYLYETGTIYEVLANDQHLGIHGCERDSSESIEEYCMRKINILQSMNLSRDSLLVLDNFDGQIDDCFLSLLSIGWKVIVITRKDRSGMGYPVLEVKEIADVDCLVSLFLTNMRGVVEATHLEKIRSIIKLVQSHTLSVKLIAKQITNSYLSIDEALQLARENGFANMADEKVEIMKDGKRSYEQIARWIQAIYQVEGMSEEKESILKLLTIFEAPGIEIKELKRLMAFSTYDGINELVESGWVLEAGTKRYLHPLIQETVKQLAWKERSRKIVLGIAEELNQFIPMYDQSGKASKEEKHYQESLKLAKRLVCHCNQDTTILGNTVFQDLLFLSLIHMPREEEEFILKYADYMLHRDMGRTAYEVMKVYNYMVYLYCQKQDFVTAHKFMKEAYVFAKKEALNHLWGLYYDMEADYFDVLLQGNYDPETDDQAFIYQGLLEAIEKGIHYMGKSKIESSKVLLAKHTLAKATLLIRNGADKKRKIYKQIRRAEKLIEKYAEENVDIYGNYYMTCGWYYTLYEEAEEKVLEYLKLGRNIHAYIQMSALDEIDLFLIPAANMMLELKNKERANGFLVEAITLCDEHKDILSFERKKKELHSYLYEVESEF